MWAFSGFPVLGMPRDGDGWRCRFLINAIGGSRHESNQAAQGRA